jgi:hypothetical protein
MKSMKNMKNENQKKPKISFMSLSFLMSSCQIPQ